MSLNISDIYKYGDFIREVASTSSHGSEKLSSEAGADIPQNSVVRYNSSNKLVQALNTDGNLSRIAGVTVAGATNGNLCEFYPSGSLAPIGDLTPSQYYFLDVDGSLTTNPAPSGVSASVRVGYAPNSSFLAVNLSTFIL